MFVRGMDRGMTNVKELRFTREGAIVVARSRATSARYRGTDSVDYDPDELRQTVDGREVSRIAGVAVSHIAGLAKRPWENATESAAGHLGEHGIGEERQTGTV